MTFEERMAELGVDLSDLTHGNPGLVTIIANEFLRRSEKTAEEKGIENNALLVITLMAAAIADRDDIIDRMETRLVNLNGERDYLLTLYGYDCEECQRYDECNRDGDYCKRDLVEDWAGVPEDWRTDDDQP